MTMTLNRATDAKAPMAFTRPTVSSSRTPIVEPALPEPEQAPTMSRPTLEAQAEIAAREKINLPPPPSGPLALDALLKRPATWIALAIVAYLVLE